MAIFWGSTHALVCLLFVPDTFALALLLLLFVLFLCFPSGNLVPTAHYMLPAFYYLLPCTYCLVLPTTYYTLSTTYNLVAVPYYSCPY